MEDTNLILHDWTHQFYFSLHVNNQSVGYNGVHSIVSVSLLLNVHTM